MTPTLDRGTVLNAVGLIVVGVLVLPFVAYAFPQAVGATQSYVVLSGSMEPAIQTGGVIFVYERPPDQIEEGDVITFNLEGPGTEVTTHRVVDVVERDGTRMFVTKGDANEDPDPAPVPPDAVIGVVPTPFGVLATIPVMGRLLLFARSDLGIALLVFVPAGLLVVSEVWSLYRAASGGGDGSEAEDGPTDADPDPAVEADAVSAPDPATSADGGTTAGGTDGEETEP